MRICLLASCVEPVPVRTWGGVEAQVDAQARGLAAAGHDVHVLTVAGPGDAPRWPAGGVTYHRIMPLVAWSGHPLRRLLPGMLRFAARAYRTCKDLQPELVHLHSRYTAYFWLKWFAAAAPPWCIIYHAHNWKQAERMQYARVSPRALARRVGMHLDSTIARAVDHVITISRFMHEEILRTTGLPAARVSVLTNMVDLETFRPQPGAARDLDILFVGRIAAEKGLHVLLPAVARLAAARPQTRLTIVGPHQGGSERGGYLGHCRQLIAECGLAGRVEFIGTVPNYELPAWMARAQVVAVPSVWNEPCGLVAIEALACGTPVVCTRVGGLPELIEDGVTGALAEAHCPAALAAALARVLADPALRARVAAEGYARAAARHSWPAQGARLLAIYQGVLAQRPASAAATHADTAFADRSSGGV